MKTTRLSTTRPITSLVSVLGGAATGVASGLVPVSNGSNGVAWATNVQTIGANGSNTLVGPFINFAAGSNMIITIESGPGGSVPSNTLRFHSIASGGGGGGAPTTSDYLVGTADAGLSNEIVVGTTPGGELGGTWASPTVDTVHSGSAHSAFQPLASDLTAIAGASPWMQTPVDRSDLRVMNDVSLTGSAEVMWRTPEDWFLQGAYSPDPVTIPNGHYRLHYLDYQLNNDLTMEGSAELVLFDFLPHGDLAI